MPATKRGIYHNLKESIYTVTNGEIVFFFSSRVYMMKFLQGYEDHRINFISHLSKYTVEHPLNMDTFADIHYYQMIEKRGFRSWLKGVDINCEEIHRYALRKMTEKNSPVWQEIQKPKLAERLKTMESTYQVK